MIKISIYVVINRHRASKFYFDIKAGGLIATILLNLTHWVTYIFENILRECFFNTVRCEVNVFHGD